VGRRETSIIKLGSIERKKRSKERHKIFRFAKLVKFVQQLTTSPRRPCSPGSPGGPTNPYSSKGKRKESLNQPIQSDNVNFLLYLQALLSLP
jgi:hypothetical protein